MREPHEMSAAELSDAYDSRTLSPVEVAQSCLSRIAALDAETVVAVVSDGGMASVMVLPRVLIAARKGDDALLRCMVMMFEDEGFKAIGVAEAAPALLASEGVLGRIHPRDDDLADVAVAVRVVRAMGALDIGQAAAVCAGLVLAVEAAEGTDRMIARAGELPEAIRGVPGKPKGVLVKAPKPLQDGKTDLPVIGTDTVKNVAAAGLAGIAVEAGAALIMNRAGVIAAADEAGIFVMGFARDAYPG